MINHLLKNNLTIEREEVETISGDSVSTFNHLKDIKGNVQPLSSHENLRAGRNYSTPVFTVFLSPNEDIKMTDKILYDNKYFDIKELNHYPNVYIEIVMSKTEG